MPIRNFNQALNSMLEKVRATLPEADVSSGTVIREIIEAYAQEAALIYSSISGIQTLQSIKLSSGKDLDNLASNYSKTRKSATYAQGIVLFTRANLGTNDVVVIPAGTSVMTLSTSLITGAPLEFKTTTDAMFDGSQKEVARSLANQYRSFLDSYGIADTYAKEVPVVAVSSGSSGNTGRGTIRKHQLSNVGHVINITSTTGGVNIESDEEFRKRLLLVFAGSNLATEFGLKSLLLDNSSVQDVAIIGPGDPLMIRDGTLVEGGTIIVPGSGGMIDVYLSGKNLSSSSEDYIFVDNSPDGSVATADNDYILGQASYPDPVTKQYVTLDYSNRQMLLTNESITLRQPVDSIVSVTGSQSGTFTYGINYELIKDVDSSSATVYSNSGFGSDRLRWTSNRISVVNEELIRNPDPIKVYDTTRYTDIISIDDIYYPVAINNEPAVITDQASSISTIDQTRKYDTTKVLKIFTKHAPVISMISAENFITGERYKIEYYTADGTVYISGRSLPSRTDTVFMSYTWQKYFDPSFDYSMSDNFVSWRNSNSTLFYRSILPSDGTILYTKPAPGTVDVMGAITSPSEVVATAEVRGLNSRAIYIHGTSMTTVLNQPIVMTSDSVAKVGDTNMVIHITPPVDSRTGAVVGGVYEKDILSSFSVLARTGQYIGRVYPPSNPLHLLGALNPNIGTSKIIYYNERSGYPAAEIDYTINDQDPTYISVKVADIGSIPSIGDTITITFLWEVRNPISQGADVTPDSEGKMIYRLGSVSGEDENIIRDVNNPAYINANTRESQVGNYDKLSYVGSVGASNNRQISYKRFASIDRITASDNQAPTGQTTFASLGITGFTSPIVNTSYFTNYTFRAPKQGERISISFLYNELVNDITKQVEEQRIINTNILVKAGVEVPLAVGLNAVIAEGTSPVTAQSAIATSLNNILSTNQLGGSVEPSYVTSELFRTVAGLVSVNYTRFTRLADPSGVKSITLDANEYFTIDPSNIDIGIAVGKETVFTNYYTEGKSNPVFRPTGQASTCPAERLVVADPNLCSPSQI